MSEVAINLNALLQSMIEGVILQDITGKIIKFNQAALEILGMTEDQLNNINTNDFDKKDLGKWDEIFPRKNHIGMECLRKKEILKNIVLKILKNDGEVRWISLNAAPVLENDQIICTFTDITEMRKIINDLKQVQLLFDVSHDFMIITNFDGYFKKVNPRFMEITGVNMKEIVSFKFLNFIHSDDVNTTKDELDKSITKREATHFINRYKVKSDEYRIFDWVAVPDLENNLIYLTARDITDYQAEELDLIHSSKVYSIGELTSGILYAITGQLSIIRNHIASIQTHIEEEKIKTEHLKSKIQIIDELIDKLYRAAKKLTSFSQHSENEEFSNIPIGQIIENVSALCKERFSIHGIKLEIKQENDFIVKVKESQISHALINLLNFVYDAIHLQRESWTEIYIMAINNVVRINIVFSYSSTEVISPKALNVPKKIIEENFGSLFFDKSGASPKFVIEFPQVLPL